MKPIRPAAEIAAREAILASGVNLTAGGRQALEAEDEVSDLLEAMNDRGVKH